MKQSELLTPWEAVVFGPVLKEFPTAHMQPYISTVERRFFRTCLGIDLHHRMIDDMKNYSNLPEWNPSDTYALDDTVLFHGCAIVSNKNDNTDLPGSDPDPGDPEFHAWTPAMKFSKDCYNELWTKFLRDYLSFMTALKAIRKSTHQAGARGLTEHMDTNTGSRSVSRTSIMDWKRETKEDALDILEEMKHWIIETYKEEACEEFANIPFVKDSCKTGSCNVMAKRSRRIFFRH